MRGGGCNAVRCASASWLPPSALSMEGAASSRVGGVTTYRPYWAAFSLWAGLLVAPRLRYEPRLEYEKCRDRARCGAGDRARCGAVCACRRAQGCGWWAMWRVRVVCRVWCACAWVRGVRGGMCKCACVVRVRCACGAWPSSDTLTLTLTLVVRVWRVAFLGYGSIVTAP